MLLCPFVLIRNVQNDRSFGSCFCFRSSVVYFMCEHLNLTQTQFLTSLCEHKCTELTWFIYDIYNQIVIFHISQMTSEMFLTVQRSFSNSDK